MFKELLLESVQDFRWTKDLKNIYTTDYENCKYENLLQSDAMGVIVGEPLLSQKYMKDIYPCFENTRKAMEKKFGKTISFYRVEINLDHPQNERFRKLEHKIKVKLVSDYKYDLKLWKKYYKKDLEEGLRKIVQITIPTEDVLAVYRPKHMDYREIHILTKRAKYKDLK